MGHEEKTDYGEGYLLSGISQRKRYLCQVIDNGAD